MTLGAWIKQQRTTRGWSQETLATLLQINRSAVSQWESGTTKPHRLRLDAVVSWFGVAVPTKIMRATWG